MNVKQVQHFYWVAKLGTYTRAAEQLGVSEPCVHRSVRSLERKCGVQLLSREKGKLRPTHAGRILQEYGERVNTLDAAAEESISDLVAPRASVVRFGVSRPFALAVGRCLATWQPKGRLVVMGGSRGELYLKVLEDELDFALTSTARLRGGLSAGDAVFEDEVVVVGRPGHPLAKRRLVSLAELANERFVTTLPGGSAHSVLMGIGEEMGVRLNVVAEVGQAETELELVAAGVGLGIRSKYVVAQYVHQGRLSFITVPGFPRRVPYGFIFRSGGVLSKQARSVLQHLTAHLASEWPPDANQRE